MTTVIDDSDAMCQQVQAHEIADFLPDEIDALDLLEVFADEGIETGTLYNEAVQAASQRLGLSPDELKGALGRAGYSIEFSDSHDHVGRALAAEAAGIDLTEAPA